MCWPGIAAAQRGRLRVDQAQLRGPARHQRGRGAAAGRAFRGTRPRAALHRVHGRRHLQRLAARARGAFAPSCATASMRAGRCGRWTRNTAAKSPRVTPSPTAAARSVSSVRSASRSAAIATARAFRPTAGSTPACSRRDGHDLRPALAQGRRCAGERVAERLVAARRPLQRTARQRVERSASTSRCIWSADRTRLPPARVQRRMHG